jgi:CubicO group peptidase (beta-lactamase class C family)
MTRAFRPDRLSRIDAALAAAVERREIAGAVALLARRGEVHVVTAGAQEFGGAPMRRETIFRIASVSKPILAAAALSLVEEGRLALDAPVGRWLPELAEPRVLARIDGPLGETVPAARPVTARDLLTFRAGFGALFFLGASPLADAMAEAGIAPGPLGFEGDADGFMRRLGALPLACQPGERWLYHTGHDVLGILLSRLEGKPLEAVLRERVLDPLGMAETRFHVPADRIGRLATAYRAGPGGGIEVFDPARGGRFAAPPAFQSGGGGLVSTAEDLLAFGEMMLGFGRHEGGRVLARPTVEAMVTDQVTPAQKAASPFFPGFWEARGWGLGLGVVTARDGPAGSPGRFGWDGGFGTSFWCDPREELAGILLVQRLWDPGWMALYDAFWAMAYGAIAD